MQVSEGRTAEATNALSGATSLDTAPNRCSYSMEKLCLTHPCLATCCACSRCFAAKFLWICCGAIGMSLPTLNWGEWQASAFVCTSDDRCASSRSMTLCPIATVLPSLLSSLSGKNASVSCAPSSPIGYIKLHVLKKGDCGVVWCVVVWCSVVWCGGVVWCGHAFCCWGDDRVCIALVPSLDPKLHRNSGQGPNRT
jgi:hypothetical protein